MFRTVGYVEGVGMKSLIMRGIIILVFFLAGIMIFSMNLSRRDEKRAIAQIMVKGNQLVSLIPLLPIQKFKSQDGNFFLRTLIEYDTDKDIAYFYIHDNSGKVVVGMTAGGALYPVPEVISVRAINTMQLLNQNFTLKESKERIFEFARPIFANGERTGAVRLGLKLKKASLFSLQNTQALAMIAFFVIAAMLLSYYGVTLALRPLRSLSEGIKNAIGGEQLTSSASFGNGQIAPIINGLKESLTTITKRLNQIETDNMNLASKLGTANFEKNRVVKILDSIPFGILIADTQDNVGHVNEYLLGLLQKSRDDVIDKPLSEVLAHDGINAFISHQDAFAHGGVPQSIDCEFPELAPGELFRVSMAYLLDDDRNSVGKVILLNNTTSEKLAENAKQEFIAHVAHELLTPLTNIKSYSEMLMDGEIEDLDMQKEFYNTINEQTTRLSDLIKNLLNISKMEVGSLTLKKGLVRTDWFVEDCLSSIEATAKEKNITIERKLPDVFPTLTADKDMLKAAVINILGNAIKYTPENGTITFGIGEQDRMVVFDVSDTGYGIAEDELPHIFDKFFRSANPQVTEEIGSGLGLAITAEIVRLHDGKIDARSELGAGTQFTIRIPREEYYLGSQ